MEKYAIIEVSGGIGKNIMATAVINSIKHAYPERKILVISGYPEVYLNNPNVYRLFTGDKCLYFYNEYVHDKDTLFMCDEPYRSNGFLNSSKHLIHSWCESINIESVKDYGELFLNPLEISNFKKSIQSDKPILLFQPFGGGERDENYHWNRDLPHHQAQQLADKLCQEYNIIQIGSGNQLKLNNCQHMFGAPLRDVFSLILFSEKILCIDSFLQHAAAAMQRPSTVCWVTNPVKVFGYDIHTNILPSEIIDMKSQFVDGRFCPFDSFGQRLHDFPFSSEDIFDIDEIIESLKSPKEIPCEVDSTIDDYFDEIYVINRKSRIDRKEDMGKELDRANIRSYRFFEAAEYDEDSFDSISPLIYNNFHLNHLPKDKRKDYVLAAVGCKTSHYECILDAKSKGYSRILILEDDLAINPNANSMFKEALEQTPACEILYLGGDYRDGGVTFQASSYAVASAAFDRILNEMPLSGMETDYYYINSLQKDQKTFRIYPPLMSQKKLDSDIQQI